MSDEFDVVVERVRKRVEPDDDERERLDAVADELRERASAAIDDLPVDADVVLVGSTARDTWLAGRSSMAAFARWRRSSATASSRSRSAASGSTRWRTRSTTASNSSLMCLGLDRLCDNLSDVIRARR